MPKVCLSPYKRASLGSAASGHATSGTRRALAFSSNCVDNQMFIPTKDREGRLDLGILPSHSPPLPVQKELVDQVVKSAVNEAVETMKNKLIEVISSLTFSLFMCLAVS